MTKQKSFCVLDRTVCPCAYSHSTKPIAIFAGGLSVNWTSAGATQHCCDTAVLSTLSSFSLLPAATLEEQLESANFSLAEAQAESAQLQQDAISQRTQLEQDLARRREHAAQLEVTLEMEASVFVL